jgi:hypothetical protein
MGWQYTKKKWDTYYDTYGFTDIYFMYYNILDMLMTVFTWMQDDCNLGQIPPPSK